MQYRLARRSSDSPHPIYDLRKLGQLLVIDDYSRILEQRLFHIRKHFTEVYRAKRFFARILNVQVKLLQCPLRVCQPSPPGAWHGRHAASQLHWKSAVQSLWKTIAQLYASRIREDGDHVQHAAESSPLHHLHRKSELAGDH